MNKQAFLLFAECAVLLMPLVIERFSSCLSLQAYSLAKPRQRQARTL
jgi:hypothetical protein